MSHIIRHIRVVPELRSSLLEEPSPADLILWRSLKPDTDRGLVVQNAYVQRFTWKGFVLVLVRNPIVDIELPEPLWAKQVPFLLALCAFTTVLAPRATRSTYALEVLPLAERFRLPSGSGWGSISIIWRCILHIYAWLCPRMFDYVGYATRDAELAYTQSFAMSRVRTVTLDPWRGSCACATTERQKIFLFAADPSPRKGFDLLLAAWASSGLSEGGWRLRCVLPVASLPNSVRIGTAELLLSPSRAALHAEFAASYATVLPSRREGRWKEQIGLSLPEGRSHGNWLICSTDVPLSLEIERESLGRVFESGSVIELASALSAVAAEWPALPPAAPKGHPRERFIAGYRERFPAGYGVRNG